LSRPEAPWCELDRYAFVFDGQNGARTMLLELHTGRNYGTHVVKDIDDGDPCELRGRSIVLREIERDSRI